MKKTKFLFFKKPDTTDIVGPEDFNDNSDKMDEILYNSARIEEAGGTANAITLKSVTLENGAIKNFIATSNNNSAATTINGKNVYRAGTTEPPTFMEKKAYCIWYNSIGDNFFTKANAEGDVDASEVLAGKYFSNDKDTHIKGTMPNNPSINAALNCSDSITIPKGYTPGGVVKANSLASQTSATAEDNKVLKGYTYWKDGIRRTGNIELLQTQTITPGTSNKIIAPGKYINGNQIIKGDANLKASNIKSGISIFGIAGTLIPGLRLVNGTVTSSSSYTGYYTNTSRDYAMYTLTVNNLKFRPRYAVFYYYGKNKLAISCYSEVDNNFVVITYDNGSAAVNLDLNYNKDKLTNTSIIMPTFFSKTEFKYFIFG